MLEISGLPEEDPENEKLTRIVDRQLNGCTTLVKRQLKQCQVSVLRYFLVILLFKVLFFSFSNKNKHHLFPISRKIAQPEQVVIVVELILLMRL